MAAPAQERDVSRSCAFHRADAAAQRLARARQIVRGLERLICDRLDLRQRVLDPVAQLVDHQPLQLFRVLSFREIPACTDNGDRLPRGALAVEFDKTPGAEPAPRPVELLHPIFGFVLAVAGGLERLRHLRPHQLEVVRVEF